MFVSAFLLLALPSTSNQLLNGARWRVFRAFTSPQNIAKSQRIAVHPFSLNEMQPCFPIHHSFSLNEMLPLTLSRCVGPWIARLYLSGNGLQKATHRQLFNRGSLLVRNVPAFVNEVRTAVAHHISSKTNLWPWISRTPFTKKRAPAWQSQELALFFYRECSIDHSL